MEAKLATFKNKGMLRDLSISKANNEFAYENYNIRITAREGDTLLSVTNERGNKEIDVYEETNPNHITFDGTCIIFEHPTDVYFEISYCLWDNGTKEDHISRIEPGTIRHDVTGFLHPEPYEPRIEIKKLEDFKGTTKYSYYGDGLELSENTDLFSFPRTLIGHCVLNSYLIMFFTSSVFDYIIRVFYDSKDNKWTARTLYMGNLNFSDKHPIETLGLYESEDVQKVYWVDGINQPRVINIKKEYEFDDADIVGTAFDFVVDFEDSLKVKVKKNYKGKSGFSPGTVQYLFTYSNKFGQETKVVHKTSLQYLSDKDTANTNEESPNCSFILTLSDVDNKFDYINIYSVIVTSEGASGNIYKVTSINIQNQKESIELYYEDIGANYIPIDSSFISYIGGDEITAGTLTQKDNTLFLGDIKLNSITVNTELKNIIYKDIKDGYNPRLYFELNENADYYINHPLYNTNYDWESQLQYSSDKVLGFKAGEKYRFGIVFRTKTGQESPVYWIGDAINNIYPVTDSESHVIKKACAVYDIPEEAVKKAEQLGYSSVKLVRAVASDTDKSIVAQGVVCPTMFNLKQRNQNAPFSLSSWFFRPENSQIPHSHLEPLPANNDRNAEIQNIGQYKKDSDEEMYPIYPPYFKEDEVRKEDYVFKSWEVFFKYRLKEGSVRSVFGRAYLRVYQYKAVIGGENAGNPDENTRTLVFTQDTEGRKKDSWNKRDTFEWIIKEEFQKFDATVTGSLMNFPGVEALTDWAVEYAMDNQTTDLKFSPYKNSGIYNMQDVLASNKSAFAEQEQSSFYVDRSIVTFHSPEINNDTGIGYINNSLKFRIVGYAELSANTISNDIDYEVSGDVDLKEEILHSPYDLNSLNITASPEFQSAFPYIQATYVNKDVQGGFGKNTFVQYPFQKTGYLYQDDSVEQYKLKRKILSNLKYAFSTSYITNIKNVDLDNLWNPELEDAVVCKEDQDSVMFSYNGKKNTYYSNYDFITTVPSENEYHVLAANNVFGIGVEPLKNEEKWKVVWKTSDPVNISAKSKTHALLSFKWDNEKMNLLPSLETKATMKTSEPDYDYGWETNLSNIDYGLTVSNIYNVFKYPVYKAQQDNTKEFSVIAYTPLKEKYDSNGLINYTLFISKVEDNLYRPTEHQVVPVLITEDTEVFESIHCSIMVGFNEEQVATSCYGFVGLTPENVVFQYSIELRNYENDDVLAVLESSSDKQEDIICTIPKDSGITQVYYHIKVDNSNYHPESEYSALEGDSEKIDVIFEGNHTRALFIGGTRKLIIRDSLDKDITDYDRKYYRDVTGASSVTWEYYADSKKLGLLDVKDKGVYFNQYPVGITKTEYNNETVFIDKSITTEESTVLIGELYVPFDTEHDSRYGGIEESALENNVFIDTGKYANIAGVQKLYGYQGDSYFQRYDILKTVPYSEDKENNIVEILSCMLESRINLDGRTDNMRGLLDNTNINLEKFNSINSTYTQEDRSQMYYILDDKYKLQEYSNQILHSFGKTLTEEIDNWTNIKTSSVTVLDGDKGPVRALRRFNNSIIAFQDKGIAEILYNSRTQLATTEGVPIEIANSAKVDGKRYITNKAGCRNKWSIVETPNGIYFIDDINSSLNIFNGQGIKSLSDEKGFRNWISRLASMNIWNPTDFDTFVSYWDRKNDDVYFNSGNMVKGTLCFNEQLGQFTSFFNYRRVPMMTNIEDKFVAFYPREQKLYLQGEGDTWCNIFGEQQDFYMEYRITPDPYGDKIFTNVEYRADFTDSIEGVNAYKTFDTLTVSNEYQKGVLDINAENSGINNRKYPNAEKKFRIWRLDIPRDSLSKNKSDRIRNPWIKLRLSKDRDKSDTSMEFHDLTVKYFE